MELLSPAGSREALLAALRMGADAVYMGASAFGARASAGFDEAALEDAIRTAHLHRRRIYVTVNTLARDDELPTLRALLRTLARLRADAVLVQDMAVLATIREEALPLCVHASTQMSVHNALGAEFLLREDVSRVVLARECPLSEIARVAGTGIETEVFAHGALCVSVSGQCEMSAMIGGRSGNRGRCAQPCRLPYAWRGQKGAWLSPRDVCLRDDLPALQQAGVASIKLEGRLKRAEYVAIVTRAYRRALDALADGRFEKASADERLELLQAFNRGGFTRGYAMGARDADIIYKENAANEGVALGAVTRAFVSRGTPFCEVALEKALHDGDGLQIGAQEIVYSGADKQAGETALVRLRESAKTGERARRLSDAKLFAEARAACEGEISEIPFNARLRAAVGEPSELTVTDGAVSASVRGEKAQRAQTAPLSADSVRRALAKTGGTPFILRDVTVDAPDAFLPASALNAMRREALSALENARIALFEAGNGRPQVAPTSPEMGEGASEATLDSADTNRAMGKSCQNGRCRGDLRSPAFPKVDEWLRSARLLCMSADAEDGKRLLAAGADAFLYAPNAFPPESDLPPQTILQLPTQCNDATLRMLCAFASARRLPVALGSVGQLGAPFATPVMAGIGVPVYNAVTANFLRARGCFSFVVSGELAKGQARLLQTPEACYAAYGRARMMLLNHCPARTALGLSGARGDCRLCDAGKGCLGNTLRDRMGAEFPLVPCRLPEGCVVSVYADKPTAILPPEGARWLLTFTTETPEERERVTRVYRDLRNGARGELPQGVPGRWQKGVE